MSTSTQALALWPTPCLPRGWCGASAALTLGSPEARSPGRRGPQLTGGIRSHADHSTCLEAPPAWHGSPALSMRGCIWVGGGHGSQAMLRTHLGQPPCLHRAQPQRREEARRQAWSPAQMEWPHKLLLLLPQRWHTRRAPLCPPSTRVRDLCSPHPRPRTTVMQYSLRG